MRTTKSKKSPLLTMVRKRRLNSLLETLLSLLENTKSEVHSLSLVPSPTLNCRLAPMADPRVSLSSLSQATKKQRTLLTPSTVKISMDPEETSESTSQVVPQLQVEIALREVASKLVAVEASVETMVHLQVTPIPSSLATLVSRPQITPLRNSSLNAVKLQQ